MLALGIAVIATALVVGYVVCRPTAWWIPTVDEAHPRILMYHMISAAQPGHQFRGLRVAPEMFEQQLKWLSEQGWTFVKMSQFRDHYAALPRKSVALTFDDGFLDNYTTAFPLLKKYDAVATLYLVINRHDNEWESRKKAHHNRGEILREPKLSDQQVQEMVDSGVFELGGHTIHHVNLATENASTRVWEITECRQLLQQQFGVAVHSFAYPFGIFEQQDVEIVKAAGFDTAVTVVEGIDTNPDFLQLRRIKVSGKDTFKTFQTRLRIGWRGYRF
jgi:peptidoglycan/xylan/chitin deacetylase (PgdA/CDA1 family)